MSLFFLSGAGMNSPHRSTLWTKQYNGDANTNSQPIFNSEIMWKSIFIFPIYILVY